MSNELVRAEAFVYSIRELLVAAKALSSAAYNSVPVRNPKGDEFDKARVELGLIGLKLTKALDTVCKTELETK